MTTPGGVPNLPVGALTIDTLASKVQDMTPTAMRGRAAERMPSLFDTSSGGNALSDLAPFGILTQIFSGFNSVVANADPADVEGPEDLPGLLIEFIESLPVVGELIGLGEAILGTYDGDDETLLMIQEIFAPIRAIVEALTGAAGGLDGLGDFFNLGDATSIGGAIAAALEGVLSSVVDMIFEAITGITRGGTDPVTDLQDILTHIPFLNVLGVGGPSNIGGSVTSGWDQLVSGFVGALGSGAGLADLFNIGSDVSSRATLGQFSFDILGIRNNKSLNNGFLPTSQSNFGFDKVALQPSAPTFALTQSTAITGYQRISEASNFGVVSWHGSGVTSITDAFVNIFKMDTTTGDNTLVHGSANIVGSLSGTMQQNVYEITTPIAVAPGDVFGIELAVRGAGTHSVVGASTWIPDQTVFPRKFSSVRNSGTSAPPSTLTPSYGTNVPFIEFGVSAGDVDLPHSTEIQQFSIVGTTTFPIPSWANFVDRLVLGGGGGGHQGGTWGIGGSGGDNANWQADTLVRGTNFTGSPSLTTVVGDGGPGGTGNGDNGSSSSSSISGGVVLTSAGGLGATSFDVLGSAHAGQSPGVYNATGATPAWTVVGGATQNAYGAAGNPAGGGGAGGNWVSFQGGGKGAPGTVLYRFRQS